MNFDRALLTTLDEDASIPGELRSCLNAHGLYSTLQFVLRLSPRIHRILAETPTGIYQGSQASFEQVQAFSTLLHETVHWWQHIGSSAGLILSLSHPVQSHANFTQLRKLLRELGAKKSILKVLTDNKTKDRMSDDVSQTANIIVNNFKDISFYQLLATRPDLVAERRIGDDPFFESVGHSYFITYAHTLRLMIDLFDPDCAFLPDARIWDPVFRKLKNDKEEGFYFGSPIAVYPVGLWHVFEGQARFTQLQYLNFSSGGKFDWDDARSMNMLSPVYLKAFETFLQLADADWPESIDSPLVGLFLAICDITINPGEGFPLPLVSPLTFVTDNDPGARFTFLCRIVALKAPHLKSAVAEYSKDEYIQVTEELCSFLRTPTPLKIADTVTAWSHKHETLITLMEENRVFRFSDIDMPARLLFARYVIFNRDKAKWPEVFCWPGAWFAGKRVSSNVKNIFLRNGALFVDKEEDDGIYPAELPGKDSSIVHETFNKFYGWIVNYNMVSQWIISPGPFKYDYEWLSTTHDPLDVSDWVGRGFEYVFGVHPDDFEIL